MYQVIIEPCKLCGKKTSAVVDIHTKRVHICNDCSNAVVMQQVKWLVNRDKKSNP